MDKRDSKLMAPNIDHGNGDQIKKAQIDASSFGTESIVFFDEECILCRSLAQWLKKSLTDWQIEGWQSFAKLHLLDNNAADRLRVWTGKELLESENAWAYLLNKDKTLQKFQWLAYKIGLKPITADFLDRTGHRIRLLCRRCQRGR